jgi:hypothetical protein
VPPEAADDLRHQFGLVQAAIGAGLTPQRTSTILSTFDKWTNFRATYSRPAYFDPDEPQLPWLLVFAQKYRNNGFSTRPRQRPLRYRTVEEACRVVAQAHTRMGYNDPRCDATGRVHQAFRLLLANWARHDDPPARVSPIPLPVLRLAVQGARVVNTPGSHALADLIWLGFFFCARPGEYTRPTATSAPFRLADVRLFRNQQPICPLTSPPALLWEATYVGMVFTNQKNGVRGEVVGLHATSDPEANPVRAAVRRILHLRQHNAPPPTPLCTYFDPNPQMVSPATITATLRAAAHALPQYHVLPERVSARSLRASGAMALLNCNVAPEKIALLARWRSVAMLRYLHTQARPLTQNFSTYMLEGGNYDLIPAQPLLAQLPPDSDDEA